MPKKKSKEEEKAPAVDAANEGESTEEEEQEAAAAEPEPDEDLLGRKKKQQPVNDGTFTFSSDPLLNEIQKKIVSVFEIFDVGGQKAVDVREVGTMCRALGEFSVNFMFYSFEKGECMWISRSLERCCIEIEFTMVDMHVCRWFAFVHE